MFEVLRGQLQLVFGCVPTVTPGFLAASQTSNSSFFLDFIPTTEYPPGKLEFYLQFYPMLNRELGFTCNFPQFSHVSGSDLTLNVLS